MRDSKETYKAISETFCNIVNGRELLNEIDFAKGPNEDELRRLFDRTDWKGPTQTRPLYHSINYDVAGDPTTWDKESERLFRSREKEAKAARIFDRGDGLDLELADDTKPDSRAKSVAKKDAIVKQFNKHRTRILANSPAPPVPEGPVTSGSLTVTPKSSSSRGMLSKLGSIAHKVAKNPFVRLGGKALGVVSAVAAPVGVYYDAQAMADLDTETTFAPYKKGKLPTFADRWRTVKRMGGM